MGIAEDWGLGADELNEILATRPSLRGMLMGFLAEYRLARMFFTDARIHGLKRYDDHDRTRPGDFGFTYQGVTITLSVKSLQSHSVRRTNGGYEGTAQVDASDKRPVILPNRQRLDTTCLVVGGFDLLAVNIFEFGYEWRFAFAKNAELPRSSYAKHSSTQRKYLLATSVKLTWPLQPPFRDEPFTLLDEIVRTRRPVGPRRN